MGFTSQVFRVLKIFILVSSWIEKQMRKWNKMENYALVSVTVGFVWLPL